MARAGSASGGEPKLIAVLKDSIRESGLSISELARRSGISQPQLSRFMSGDRTLTLRSAARLFEVLNLDVVRGQPPGQEAEPAKGKPVRHPERKRRGD